jgi:hypothetical protein
MKFDDLIYVGTESMSCIFLIDKFRIYTFFTDLLMVHVVKCKQVS